jgi:hypothetical protein
MKPLTCVLALFALALSLASPVRAEDPSKLPEKPKKEEPSIHGTWNGDVSVPGSDTRLKFVCTFREDGTYKLVSGTDAFPIVETGKFGYIDGVLLLRPDNAKQLTTLVAVKFEDKNTLKYTGCNGTIVLKRQ